MRWVYGGRVDTVRLNESLTVDSRVVHQLLVVVLLVARVLVENVQIVAESTHDEAVVELSHHLHPSKTLLHVTLPLSRHLAQFQRQLGLHDTLGRIGAIGLGLCEMRMKERLGLCRRGEVRLDGVPLAENGGGGNVGVERVVVGDEREDGGVALFLAWR